MPRSAKQCYWNDATPSLGYKIAEAERRGGRSIMAGRCTGVSSAIFFILLHLECLNLHRFAEASATSYLTSVVMGLGNGD